MYSSYLYYYSNQLPIFIILHFLNTFPIFSLTQCPPLQPPCRCSPSIHEPVAIVCENASTLSGILTAIAETRGVTVCYLCMQFLIIYLLIFTTYHVLTIL